MNKRGFAAIGASIMVVVGAAAYVGTTAGAAFPGNNGLIAYDTGEAGGIATIQPDGSGQRTLVDDGNANAPAWSADGTKIAYTEMTDPDQIWVMNADGSDPHQVTTDIADHRDPAWSPDGTRLVYIRDGGGNYEIWSIGADGTDPVQLTANGFDNSEPAWSPDGTQIAWVVLEGKSDTDIWVMNADGTNPHQITDDLNHDEFDPNWSPDGTRIAYSYWDEENDDEIGIMNADGTDAHLITDNDVDDDAPAWSPDGTRIAFIQDGNIYTMDPDGANPALVATGGRAGFADPDWQPIPVDEPTTTTTPTTTPSDNGQAHAATAVRAQPTFTG